MSFKTTFKWKNQQKELEKNEIDKLSKKFLEKMSSHHEEACVFKISPSPLKFLNPFEIPKLEEEREKLFAYLYSKILHRLKKFQKLNLPKLDESFINMFKDWKEEISTIEEKLNVNIHILYILITNWHVKKVNENISFCLKCDVCQMKFIYLYKNDKIWNPIQEHRYWCPVVMKEGWKTILKAIVEGCKKESPKSEFDKVYFTIFFFNNFRLFM